MADVAPKKETLESGGSIRLHYFPDIPTASKRCDENRERTESGFERIDFEAPNGRADGAACRMDQDLDGDGEKERVNLTPDQLCEIENQAYARGLETGRAAGVASEQQKVHQIREHLEQVMNELNAYRNHARESMETEAVKLVMAVARKVVCHELKMSKDTIVGVIREAFKKIVDSEQVTIRLNPQDHAFLKSHNLDIQAILSRVEDVSFEPDESVSIGGCVIQTQLGDIDARLEKQLQVIADAFQSGLNRSIESP